MIKSEDLQLVTYLSQEKSIAAVARRMNLTPSAVSQRLSILEDRIGLALADRIGRSGIVLTGDGKFLAQSATRVLTELNLLQDELNNRRGIISGAVSVVAPFGFGRRHVASLLGQFSKLHPSLSIDLRLSDDLSSLPDTSWDILIRVAPFIDSSLASTVLSENKRLVCASPAYVKKYGLPKHPEDLKQHRCISISEDGSKGAYWTFRSKKKEEVSIKIQPDLMTNDGEVALDWAINGLGVIMRSEWSAAAALKAGQLTDVMPVGWSAPEAPIVALTTARHSDSVRISSVVKYLAANMNFKH